MARFARLSKVVVFFITFVCNSKGYVERVISLPSLEREGSTFSGVTLLASQRWCFGTFVCTSMGYVESETSLAFLASQK